MKFGGCNTYLLVGSGVGVVSWGWRLVLAFYIGAGSVFQFWLAL